MPHINDIDLPDVVLLKDQMSFKVEISKKFLQALAIISSIVVCISNVMYLCIADIIE